MSCTELFSEELEAFFGRLFLAVDAEGAVHATSFAQGRALAAFDHELEGSHAGARVRRGTPDGPGARARQQLAEYLARERRSFQLELRPSGTPFQRTVWRALEAIPYGQTISYLELARRVAAPQAARAVGHANHLNPLPILVPCHRVIGADGHLVGFGGGLDTKRALLDFERGQRSLDELLDG